MLNCLGSRSHLLLRVLVVVLVGSAFSARADFEPDVVGTVEKLPAQYPAHWALVHDFSFFHMLEGKVAVVDPLAETAGEQFKGMMTASFISGFEHSAVRREHYVIESFFSRGGRGGERSEFVTVYDPATLLVAEEISIPNTRITGMPKRIATGLLGGDRFLAVYNFSPGQSVSIVDLESRSFVGEVSTPGCGFVIPNGERSFTSLCSNGALLTTNLDTNGQPSGSSSTNGVIDVQDDPVFEGAILEDGKGYLPTFQGRVVQLDLSGDEIRVDADWWLTNANERNWRPGGMKPMMSDATGAGYFLMNPEGGEGTHKDGGAEVWAYDLAAEQRTHRIELKNWGVSIGTSGDADAPLMFVTNAEMGVDVYRLPKGEYVHTLAPIGDTPFMVYSTQ